MQKKMSPRQKAAMEMLAPKVEIEVSFGEDEQED